jgi:hypothetical protein
MGVVPCKSHRTPPRLPNTSSQIFPPKAHNASLWENSQEHPKGPPPVSHTQVPKPILWLTAALRMLFLRVSSCVFVCAAHTHSICIRLHITHRTSHTPPVEGQICVKFLTKSMSWNFPYCSQSHRIRAKLMRIAWEIPIHTSYVLPTFFALHSGGTSQTPPVEGIFS